MKKLFLLVICLFLTGCSVEYHVNIKEGNFIDNILISGESNESIEQIQAYDTPVFAFLSEARYDGDSLEEMERFSFYDREIVPGGLELSYIFSSNDYYDHYLIDYCYGNFSSYKDDEKIVHVVTGKKFQCMDYYTSLDKVSVTVDVFYDVVEHNADNVSGYTYTWVIDRENYNDKSIYLAYDSTKKSFSLISFLEDNAYYVGIISVILVIGLGYLFIKKREEVKNVI